MNPPEQLVIRRLVGVYDAEGSVRGELTYLLAKATGRAHCALCDITHNWVRPSREFRNVIRGIPVPFDFVHSDTPSEALSAASGETVPCVLAQTDDGLVLLLDPDDIERCEGAPAALLDALRAAAHRRDLGWPERS